MIVLDTHAWIWLAADAKRIPAAARHAIDAADRVGVCAISLWEVAMLVAKGRLEFDRDTRTWLQQALALPRVELLPLTPELAVESAGLPATFPGDPADRLIVAAARLERAVLVTRDARIRGADAVKTVWG